MIDMEKIRQLRKEKKISVNSLADMLGVSRFTVTSWEHNRTTPSKSDLVVISQLLGVSLREICDYNDPLKEIHAGEPIDDITSNSLENIIASFEDPDSKLDKSKLKNILLEQKALLKKNNILKRANDRFQAIFSSINEIVYIKNQAREIRMVNDKFVELFQNDYMEDELIGLKFIDIFGRKEIEDILKLENTLFSTGISIVDERVRIPGSNGKRIGLATLKSILDSKGNIIEIAVSIKDITDILENLEKLELLKNISYKLDENIWIMSEYPAVYRFLGGESLENVYGHSKEELTNNPLVWFDDIDDEDQNKLGYKHGDKVVPLGEYTLKLRDQDKWLKYKSYRTKDLQDKSIIYGITADITEEKIKTLSLEYLDHSIKNSGEVIFAGNFSYIDNDFKFLYLSENCEKILGLKRDLLLVSINNLIENLEDQYTENTVSWLKSKKRYREIIFQLKVDGNIKYFHGKLAQSDENLCYGSITDISQLKEEQYKRFLLESAINSTREAVWVYDLNQKIYLATKSVLKLYKMPADIQKPFQFWRDEILFPEYMDKFDIRFLEYQKEKAKNPLYAPDDFYFKGKLPDGEIIEVEVKFSCMEYEGKILDIAVDRNITSRKS